jgi:hypothetical protein
MALSAQTFRVGLYGGVNVTDVDGADLTDNDNDFHKFGFNAGLLVSSHAGKKNILQMEIGYSQTGSSQPPDTTHTNNYYTLRFNYVNVALAIRHRVHFNLSKKPTDRFDLNAGVSIGYLFSAYYTVQSIVYYKTSEGINLLSSNFNPIDISPFVGITYNFSSKFAFDLRYYNSVTSVIPHEVANTYFLYYGSWNAGHNLVFQGTFRYTFGTDPDASIGTAPAPATPAN